MKIQGQGPIKGAQFINAYKKAEKVASKKEALSDSLELSEQAKEIAQLQKQALGLPDIRQALVHELRQKISTNTYHVPAKELAGKLYEEIANDRK